MRKLIVESFLALDGVIESPMRFASPFFDEESKDHAYRQLADADYFLLGRVAYQIFSASWPSIQGDKYFDRINGLKKLVASRTLDAVTWNASLIKGDVAETLRKLKEEGGGAIVKYGVTQLDRALLENKLVDEYKLWLLPTRGGSGKRAFDDIDMSAQPDLELTDVRRFANGSVILSYVPH